MARRAAMTLRGEQALIKKLKRLSNKSRLRRVLRAATNASGQELVKPVRRIWATEAKETGLSAKSVTKKIIKTPGGFMAIVGIDKDAVGTRADGGRHIPANIDHLIEFGFQLDSGQTVPAVAPLRRGFEAGHAAAERRFAEKAGQAIEREATRQ